MSGYGVWGLEQAFPGRRDCTTPAMQRAVADWFGLYFDDQITLEEDPCQRLPVVVVSKLQRACFAEYRAICGEEFGRGVLRGLEEVRSKAMQLALIGGECWLRPALTPGEIGFTVLRRDAVAVLARDSRGRAVELVSGEEFRRGKEKYTLLERRCQTGQGTLVENRLFCSRGGGLGMPVPLDRLPQYAALQPRLLLEGVEQLGLVNLRLPLENCVDGSPDPVSVYAAAAGLHFKLPAPRYASVMGDFGGAEHVGEFEIYARGDDIVVGNMSTVPRGKISASADGFAAAFIRLPADANFRASAVCTVLGVGEEADGQSAFGMMLRDDIYADEYFPALASNYVAAGSGGTFCRLNGKLCGCSPFAAAAGDRFTLSIERINQQIRARVNDRSQSWYDFDLAAVDSASDYLCLFAARHVLVRFSGIKFELTGKSVRA